MAWQPQRLSAGQKQERRFEAARVLRRGVPQACIARELSVTEAAVSKWAARLRSGGLRALHAHRHLGCPPRLTATQRQQVAATLRAGALAAGFPTERWTLRRIAHVIQRRYGVHYQPNDLGNPLHRLGFSPQRPLTYARERDEALVQAWLRHDWPRVKKGLAEAGQCLPSWTRQVIRFGPA
ncbi:winged helix-turn-helix domain-containing protein [Stigmatella aurantiaca]|uniref:Transposase n=1 Tax=Stigmatella aurantiaca (strain DW4/3-1) TaxID=378806 RepID=E3FFJ0_STIAD|nr:winged helix-turn-helix domain-containing protein [Stigmatella aurantiaca]ADO72747.1 Transposase [Stigmatella aurantiaca DW4/3-1]